MDDAHLSPKDIITREDFQKIPPTEKKHYRKNFPVNVLAKDYSLKDKGLYRAQSSGTTGERLITHELGFLFFQRAFACLSVYPAVHSAFYANPRKHIRYAAPNCSDVECANPNSTMQDRLLNDGTLVLSVYHDLLTTPEQILEQVDQRESIGIRSAAGEKRRPSLWGRRRLWRLSCFWGYCKVVDKVCQIEGQRQRRNV